MTDGHTRAMVALWAGVKTVATHCGIMMNWLGVYQECLKACRERGISSPEGLVRRVIPEEEYKEKWDLWCDRMQGEIEKKRRKK